MENAKNERSAEIEKCRTELSQLRSENEELSRSLFEVNRKLRDSERLKGHFISNITNEIINPFASILALAENIKQLNEDQLLQARRMAEFIYDEAFHLDFQLKNIFAAAMLEAGLEEIKPAQVRLDEYGVHLSDYFHSQLIKESINLDVSCVNLVAANEPPMVVADREKLDLILKNLISNAIKFSRPGSGIGLHFVREEDRFSVEVSDRGKGINPDDRKVIFDRFKQLDEKINSLNTGHGLGLSIVQAYTEMLGGVIHLTDNEDKGIRFTIALPDIPVTTEWNEMDDFLLDTEKSY